MAGGSAIATRLAYDANPQNSRSGFWHLRYEVSFEALREGDRLQIWLPQDSPHLRIYRQTLNNPDLVPENLGSTIQRSRLDLVAEEPGESSRLQELLQSGTFQLNERFRSKAQQILAITGSWTITEKV